MSRKESPPLSINQAYELSPGDKNNPVWVNNVQGVVLSIKTGRMGAADTWPVVLGNDGGGRSLEVVFWQEPRFAKGDLLSLDGGCRRTEFKGVQSISVGQKTEVHVIRKGGNQQEPHREERSQSTVRDDSRGGGESDGDRRPTDEPSGRGDDRAVAFHQKMAANANLYLQCLSYARKIDATLKSAGKPEMAPDHFQACVSTLFITADRAGMSVAPPPWTGKAEEKAAPPPVRRDPPPPSRRDAPPDEDVPF